MPYSGIPQAAMDPVIAEIDLSALLHNLEQARKRVGGDCRLLGVVKANAYGHGAVPVAEALLSAGVFMLGVAWVKEGVELRRAGMDCPILVMAGFSETEASEVVRFDLAPVVYRVSQVHALQEAARRRDRRVKIHLKLDTGMGRLGVAVPKDLAELLTSLRKAPHLIVEGVMTHIAEDGLKDRAFTREQLDRFEGVLQLFAQEGLHVPLRHAANSAMTIDLPLSHFDMVRPGIMLYGYLPSKDLSSSVDLRPVMTLKSRIAHLKRVPKGTPISYGRTFVTSRESLIGVLPVGYADGFPRALSNRGEVLVGCKRAPIVGRVCMDMTMVDLTGREDVKIGQEVVLMGRQGEACLPADEVAQKSGTIAYEILCGVAPRVTRVYKKQTV